MTEVMDEQIDTSSFKESDFYTMHKSLLIEFIDYIKLNICTTDMEKLEFNIVTTLLNLSPSKTVFVDFTDKVVPYENEIVTKNKDYFLKHAKSIFNGIPDSIIQKYCNKIVAGENEIILEILFEKLEEMIDLCNCYKTKFVKK